MEASHHPSQLLPESYEMSQSQFTQTQPQTQPDTQPASSSTAFPSHLWGILLSSSGESTSTSLVNADLNAGAAIDRPTRFDFVRPSFGGKQLYTVGRHPKSDIRLESPKVSSNHAKIWTSPADGLVRLEDLSTNGTFVRGVKVGKGKITILEPGDSIIFGPQSVEFGNDFRYVFQCPPANSSRTDPYGLGELSQSGSKVFSKYEVREQIGKGSFASVRKGIRREDGTMVAIKIIQKARFANNPKTLEMFSREIEIIQQLDHTFCVKCYDWFEDEARLWIILEYVDGGDLLDYTMKKKGLSERETREIALMVCQAVAYLHARGITHRDLKPENLLLTKGPKPVCKVTDFGLAKMTDNQTMLRTMCGTPTYLAPEVILNPNPSSGYSPLVDAWSIGVVLFSLLTCQTPFDESESTPLPQRMRERRVDFDFLQREGFSDLCLDFLKKLLVADPAKRMSCAQALAHPWLMTLPLANSTNSMSASSLLSLYPSTKPTNGYTVPKANEPNPAFHANGNGYDNRGDVSVSSSPISTFGRNPHQKVGGLMSAFSLSDSVDWKLESPDSVKRSDRIYMDGNVEKGDESMVDSQAIGNLRLSHPPSPTTTKPPSRPTSSKDVMNLSTTESMPPPPPVTPQPVPEPPLESNNVVAGQKRKQPSRPTDVSNAEFENSPPAIGATIGDVPSTVRDAKKKVDESKERGMEVEMKQPKGDGELSSAFSDSSLSDLEPSPPEKSQGMKEDEEMKEVKGRRETRSRLVQAENTEEPSTTEEIDPAVDRTINEEEDDEDQVPITPVPTRSTRASTRGRRTSTSTPASTSGSARGKRAARGGTRGRSSMGEGGRRTSTRGTPNLSIGSPSADEDVGGSTTSVGGGGGIADSVKNRRRKAARLQ